MKSEILSMRKYIILILIAIFTFLGLNNLDVFLEFLGSTLSVFSPFILGGAIAFILNIPMKKIESLLKKKIKNKDSFVRTISIILSLLLFIVVILFVALLLIPELVENIKMLINNIPGLIDKIEVFLIDLVDKYPDIRKQVSDIFSGTGNISDVISGILNYFLNGAVGFVGGLVSGFTTMFMAIVFAIYMLGQKEHLIRGSKKVIYALFSKKKANKIIEIGNLTNDIFSKFLSGQCVEAIILGFLMFIAFIIFRFPYALLISVLTAITALIPIFGALIAMAIGCVLIAITNPIQAVIFVIVFQVVQQIEGNFIYPKVVGKSVGLSAMWTLLAITVGGNLFGIVGMFVGLPLTAVIYTLVKDLVNDRLKTKEINIT